jgi:hypothetical protein
MPLCLRYVLCAIQAVFVSQDIEADASIYYKQAMMEAAEEVYTVLLYILLYILLCIMYHITLIVCIPD